MKKSCDNLHVNQSKPENGFETMLGIRCRQRRDELKLSRNKVADMVGVSLSTLQAWENQEREPTASDIIKLANALSVSASWLLSGECANTENSQTTISQTSNQGLLQTDIDPQIYAQQRLIAIISALDSSEVEHLSKLLALNGARYLSRLLNPENQDLLQLEGRKRLAALMLVDMSDERVREILEEIETDNLSSSVKAKAG
ncbi:helix-turn-helix domain-containing protein [Escherichia coli]|uniref:helix-turn-helix domain-containing protein n=1 Tax=Escherichia coli TaxID=562 RepID=UPI00181E721D|nr:helix-turn-helix domain-containing protein [Escherichia coli]EGZ6179345.1 helix-turn-helix domain-containing protein [Salmonella enterica subsp. enterica serovar Montevideo]EFD0874114.1 helix-turn-helix domain-containing protein [Escherichia coli]EFD0879433.1 helix-turn-helix domain-containing protein [Escherichia coli]EGT2341684.1 helix-turn-helix domain-containing protein [Escherichia coli]EHC5049104.1 helix-turn-helix domain-containing protein [Escherichia coli]